MPAGLPHERGQVDDEHLYPRCLGGRQARAARKRPGRAGRDRERRGDGSRVRQRRRHADPGRRGGRRRRGRHAEHAADPAALRAAGQPEQPSRRPQPRLPPGASRLRPVRRAPGRTHGLPDHRARDAPPARRRRRLRDRGDDDPDPIGFATDDRGRARPALGCTARRGCAQLPALDRHARDVQRRQQRPSSSSTRTATSCSARTSARPSSSGRGGLAFSRDVLDAAGATESHVDGARQHARAGNVPDGQRSRAVGRRRRRRSRGTSSGSTSATARSSRARCP